MRKISLSPSGIFYPKIPGEIVVNMPLYIEKSGKKRHLNLNNYRNWHYQVSNYLKQQYKAIVNNEMQAYKLIRLKKIRLTFTLYKGDKRKVDRANVLSIHEKFFCDAIVELGFIQDDNDSFIESTHYYSGDIDKLNPRVEIRIELI